MNFAGQDSWLCENEDNESLWEIDATFSFELQPLENGVAPCLYMSQPIPTDVVFLPSANQEKTLCNFGGHSTSIVDLCADLSRW
jgi:hypothetical protein